MGSNEMQDQEIPFYFTFMDESGASKSVAAIYNGRMAFVAGLTRAGIKAHQISDVASADPTLHHELCHRGVFSLSRIGKILSGHRLHARARYLKENDLKVVEEHYRARSIF